MNVKGVLNINVILKYIYIYIFYTSIQLDSISFLCLLKHAGDNEPNIV